MVSIELMQTDVKQFVPQKNVTLYCSMHKGKELELYCETCEELICFHCTVNKHHSPAHNYNLVSDTFEKYKTDITVSLRVVDELHASVKNSLKLLDVRLQELNDQQVNIETSIHREIEQLHQLLEARKVELIGQVDEHIKRKLKNLEAQRCELETVFAQLDSCLSFVRESLKTESQGEVMKMKRTVTKQIKEMTDNFNRDKLLPCEQDNLKFMPSPELILACQQAGQIYLETLSPKKCYVSGEGVMVGNVGEISTAFLKLVDDKVNAYTKPVETLICELVSEQTGEKIECTVKKTERTSWYNISYQPTKRGRHQLQIKVKGEHINGSPIPVIVKLPVEKLGTPVKVISGLEGPTGVAFNKRGEIIVTNQQSNCVSIYSPTGEKLRSFGSRGSKTGQFNLPWGVAVDNDDNILVADVKNDRIQKFTSAGKFITTTEKKARLKFNHPRGIAINPHNKIYVVDNDNHRILILNSDLTYSSSIGREGRDHGEFSYRQDVALDSAGNLYVADGANHCIQVFKADGQFSRKIGKPGKRNGELNWPFGICIDSDNIVYVAERENSRVSVFTCKGDILKSFGTEGSEPGQFRNPCGIAVDNTGMICVSDTRNNRLQFF